MLAFFKLKDHSEIKHKLAIKDKTTRIKWFIEKSSKKVIVIVCLKKELPVKHIHTMRLLYSVPEGKWKQFIMSYSVLTKLSWICKSRCCHCPN